MASNEMGAGTKRQKRLMTCKESLQTALNFYQSARAFNDSASKFVCAIDDCLKLWENNIEVNTNGCGGIEFSYFDCETTFATIEVRADGSLNLWFDYDEHLFKPYAEALRNAGFIVNEHPR